MLAHIKGKFEEKSPSKLVMDVNGIGYEVQISLNTYAKIQNAESGKLYIVMIVREDAHILYGFYDVEEKNMFVQLIGISGVGTSTARIMLSYLKPPDLASAIVQGNIAALEAIKGIGKKTAERIVVELKDKLAKASFDTNILSTKGNTNEQEALEALTALGINKLVAEKALKKIEVADNNVITLEEMIKMALRNI